jgi:autotransporter-associated beta strand protein
VSGGAGGAGGASGSSSASQFGGSGGAGGIGVQFLSGGTLNNAGTITGGAGGAGGASTGTSTTAGSSGAGGAGVTGSGITVVTSGSITGGLGGDGVTRANAVTFTGGANTLTLQTGASFTGNIGVQAGTLTFLQPTSQTLSTVVTGGGAVVKDGAGTLILTGANTYTGGTTVTGGILQGNTTSLQGDILNNATVVFDQASTGTYAGNLTGTGGVTKQGVGTLTLTGTSTFSGGLAVNQGILAAANVTSLGGGGLSFNGGTLQALGTLGLTNPVTINSGGGTIDTNGNNVVASGAITGSGGLTKIGSGNLTFQTAMSYTGGTTVNVGTLELDSAGGALPTGGALSVNGGLFDMSQIATGQSVGALAGTGGQINLGANNLTTNSSASTTLATQISGTGALIKQGSGVLTLTGNNLYSGGTQIQGGLVNFSSLNNFGTGQITLGGGGLQWATGTTTDISSRLAALGAGGATFDTNGNNVIFAGGMSGTGGVTKQGSGILNLTGANTYTGLTSVAAGTLAVNGSITSSVTVGAGGTLGGTGTIMGTVTTQGTVAPGNSIGTLNVTGSFVQAAGSIYQVEANAQGQSDRIAVTGTSAIQGGTVQVLAQPGTYGTSTTYTILSTTGGRTGAYSGVNSNFAFLTPSLTYDANNVYLTLALLGGGGSGFLMSAYTPNQTAVGAALNQSFSGATGDYLTVINGLASLTAFQGPAALNALSGEQYADFGTMNVNNSAMFMNAVGQQMALARGTVAGSGQRASLAQACDIASCDDVSRFSVWASGLGGLGAVAGDYNASTATYNFAGAAVGIDYRLDPRFLVGLGVAYTAGNLWVNSFPGKGTTDSVAVAAYGSFTQGGFYADLLGGYGYFYNQAQRQILIPGLQPRTANGAASAHQAMGQVETGYRIGVYRPASATVTPFARLQGSSVTQNAFSESGAQSLSLNVAQQTTNSLRTLFGVDLAGAVPVSSDRTIDLGLRVGWQHEFASTARPITAALSGAPFAAFTVYGATPQPDSAVVNLRASTSIAQATRLYLRYDGDIGSGTANHAFNVGVRLSW